MFRNVIPPLAKEFYVIAPDLPGFGFSEVPSQENFEYSFDNYAKLMNSFLENFKIKKASFYLFDYGAPILMRIIENKPEMVDLLIFQNGNIHNEGVGDVLKKTKRLFEENTQESLTELKQIFELHYTKWEYLNGVRDRTRINPESYFLDQFLLDREGNKAIQLELKRNYKTNVTLYNRWQENLIKFQHPTLIVWGENDEVFKKEGALMLKKDNPNSKLVFYPTGHFALEEFGNEISIQIIQFWQSNFKK
jgi:pimeloyl-ACP methyl ester carboxylesterase